MEIINNDLVQFMIDINSENECLKYINSLCSTKPEIYTGTLNLNFSEHEDFLIRNGKDILSTSRNKWAGLSKQSLIFWEDPDNTLKFTIAVSSEIPSFSMFIIDFIKEKVNKLQDLSDLCFESDNDSEIEIEEKDKLPGNMVQIVVDSSEVKNWIESFIKSRREHINNQNNEEFFLSKDKRLNCARVDAVLIKRKDTVSHIRVEHVKNLWGPQVMKNLHNDNTHLESFNLKRASNDEKEVTSATDPESSSVKKKVYSTQELDFKLEELIVKRHKSD